MPTTKSIEPRKKTTGLILVLLVGVALGSYWAYMKYSATGIEATVEYPYAERTINPDLDKIFIDETESGFDLFQESSKRQYSEADRQKLIAKATAAGAIYPVPIRTRILVLERHWGSDKAKVKILDGPSIGKVGFVNADYVKVPFWGSF